MALTPAQKQRRYRERLKAVDQTNPDAIERELLQEVARCDRGEMPDQERIALADKLADLRFEPQLKARRTRPPRALTKTLFNAKPDTRGIDARTSRTHIPDNFRSRYLSPFTAQKIPRALERTFERRRLAVPKTNRRPRRRERLVPRLKRRLDTAATKRSSISRSWLRVQAPHTSSPDARR
jgi:hypothetical protein